MAAGNGGLLGEVGQRVDPNRLVGAGRGDDGKVRMRCAEPGASVARWRQCRQRIDRRHG